MEGCEWGEYKSMERKMNTEPFGTPCTFTKVGDS
jgi:hypothetical protein